MTDARPPDPQDRSLGRGPVDPGRTDDPAVFGEPTGVASGPAGVPDLPPGPADDIVDRAGEFADTAPTNEAATKEGHTDGTAADPDSDVAGAFSGDNSPDDAAAETETGTGTGTETGTETGIETESDTDAAEADDGDEDADFSDTLDFSGTRKEEDEQWSEADLFVLLDFLTELTEALTAAGSPVGQIGSDVEDAARALGVRSVQVLVFTTAVFISLPKIAPGRVKMAAALLPSLRLDQIAAVYRLMDEVQTGYVTPASALRQLRAIEAMPSRFSRTMTILGHAILAVGLGLILGPSTWDILVAGLLGAGVAVVKRWGARGQGRDQILPAAVSFAVATMVFFAAKHGAVINPMHALLPPLVTFLPGAALTTATLELSSGHTMSGSSRLVAASVQLGLLAFGIISAAQLVGLPTTAAFASNLGTIGLLTPWLGVLVFSIGVYLHFSVPRRTLPWVLLVLYVAYAAQVVGGVFFGGYLSGFVGAVVMVPVALFVARQPSGPPMMVTFLPSFWLLVPGAVSLVGLTQLFGVDGQAGLQTLLSAAGTVVAIALGVLVGIGVDEALVSGQARGAETLRRVSRSLGQRDRTRTPDGPG